MSRRGFTVEKKIIIFVLAVAVVLALNNLLLPFANDETTRLTTFEVATNYHEIVAKRSYGSNNTNYNRTDSVLYNNVMKETKLDDHNKGINVTPTNTSKDLSLMYQSNQTYEYQGSYSGTTCHARFPNRTPLQIDSTKKGGFPETQFTHYIQTAIIDRHKIGRRTEICEQAHISIRADKNGTVKELRPIYLDRENKRLGQFNNFWKLIFKRVLSEECNRVLPSLILPVSNVSHYITPFGVSGIDYTLPKFHKFKCFASSSPGGIFSVFNFHDLRDFALKVTRLKSSPWEERNPIPIWRGTLWDLDIHAKRAVDEKRIKSLSTQELAKKFYSPMIVPVKGKAIPQRVPLIGFSLDHPELLNARVGSQRGSIGPEYNEKLPQALKIPPNVGLDDYIELLLPTDGVPKWKYYTEYQVTIVMGGIGAAFRTSCHLAVGSAVVLQDFPLEEWFIPYMRPFVDYIPLNYNISNLEETLIWIKENPTKVKEIASNGRLFYERYLSFEKMEEFIYELVYRLAEDRIYKGIYDSILTNS